MRAHLTAAVVAGSMLLTVAVGGGAAVADDPTVSEIQVRLVETRQDLNALYAQSAAASERLNGATVRLDEARADLEEHRGALRTARAALTEQREEVAAMTVERLQAGTTARALGSMLDGGEPTELLEQATANSAVDQAMTSVMDDLDARQTVLDSASRAVAASVADAEAATGQQRAAREDIDAAIDRARERESSAEAERDSLLRQLARAQQAPLAEVTRTQDAIDARLDRSGPSGSPAQPAPSTPRPTPRPTTPKPPSTPAPPDPPPASGSRVETAIAFARAQLGEEYVWGAAGPGSWDCSGLTMRAYQAAGVNLPHYAGSQYAQTTKVPVSKIRRGDLLFWSDGGAGSIYHVALYLGGGQMIQAPRPGRGVEIVPLTYWIAPDLASRPA